MVVVPISPDGFRRVAKRIRKRVVDKFLLPRSEPSIYPLLHEPLKLRRFKYVHFFRFVRPRYFINCQMHVGHALTEWHNSNAKYVVTMGRRASLFNFEAIFLAYRRVL